MRRDIQLLRGIAVLYVVIYHAGVGLFNQGFLGVDIFFTLSGFLITLILLKGIDDNQNFTFGNFYYRRAKRLLPALYSTLIFTTLGAIVFLTEADWGSYLEQLLGALTFSSNLILPGQAGYFASASEGKPLLHIWSLSLEEQYYFFLPLLLFFTPKTWRLSLLIILCSLSLLWCLSWVYFPEEEAPFFWRLGSKSKLDWAFYLLPTRAWELMLGSIVALLHHRSGNSIQVPYFCKVLAISIIIIVGSLNLELKHPGIGALIVCLSTCVILLNNREWLPQLKIIKFIEKIGDYSYSIYLVHWPLFAFAFLAYIGVIPLWVKLSLILLSIALGYMQYAYVEQRFRYNQHITFTLNLKLLFASSIILILIPLTIESHPSYNEENSFAKARKPNNGFSAKCESFPDSGGVWEECKNHAEPDVAVWGDSFSMHLIPGLSAHNNIVQITKPACSPFRGIAINQGAFDEAWGANCLKYTEQALNYIKQNKSIKYVVLSAPLVNLSNEGGLAFTNNGLKPTGEDILADAILETVGILEAAGKSVILFSPPPRDNRNIGECLERKYGPAIMFVENCDIDKADSRAYLASAISVLEKIQGQVKIFDLEQIMCDELVCKSELDGTFLYRDRAHVTIEGSKLLFGKLRIKELL
ncbi:MAG: peptidoglycan/LPS O-acetylase OafA/YrhL [Francisellaceae bacterium]|jgi:peptidoglycan/LPS O-acetylase OafA/YrhL